MKRGPSLLNWLIVVLFGLLLGAFFGHALSASSQYFIQTFQVQDQETFDFKGTSFIELVSPKGSILISSDEDLPITQELKRLNKRKVILTIEEVPK